MANILALGAHFDDIELGCSGTLAKHKASGDNVFVYVATLSGYNNQKNEVIRANDVARAEGELAAKKLGATLYCGSFPTMGLEFCDELNIDILNILHEHRIDTLYTHWYEDVHHDHQALAKASLHCARHVPKILMYRSNWYQSQFDFKGNFYVDITDFWHIKEELIRTYHSEFVRAGAKWLEFYKNDAINAGMQVNVSLAEKFEVVKWLS